jgi:hypothetical protein
VLLQQRLEHGAGHGGGHRPEPARAAPSHGTRRAGSAAAARSGTARSRTSRTTPVRDPDLAHLPSVAQIAAEIRRLPLQQVIAMICRDLGITPDHELWQQLNQALAGFGVSLPVPGSERSPTLPRPGATEPGADAPRAEASDAPTQPPPTIAVRQARAPLCTGPPVSADHYAAG